MPEYINTKSSEHHARSINTEEFESADDRDGGSSGTSRHVISQLRSSSRISPSSDLITPVSTRTSTSTVGRRIRQRFPKHVGIAESSVQRASREVSLMVMSARKSGTIGSGSSSISTESAPPAKIDDNIKNHRKASVLQALPAPHDHTSDLPNVAEDEYVPREYDDAGETKVDGDGHLHGGRQYNIRTFTLSGRAGKLFMLATECARTLQYRDSYLLFNENRSLFKVITRPEEKDELVTKDILPYSYRSRQIALVTARSMFRQFGSRVIKDGRHVQDDYWEAKARERGFIEEDAAGEKRPGAAKARKDALEVSEGRQHTTVSSVFDPIISTHDITYITPQLLQQPQRSVIGPVPRAMPRLSMETLRPGQFDDVVTSTSSSRQYRHDLITEYWSNPHDFALPVEKAEVFNNNPLVSRSRSTELLQTEVDAAETLVATQSLEERSTRTNESTVLSKTFSPSMGVVHSTYTNKYQVPDDSRATNSPLTDPANPNSTEHTSLLVAVYSFYALCRQAVELTVGASKQQLVFGSGSSDTFVIPRRVSTSNVNNAGGLSNKRKADDIGDQGGQDSNGCNISTARKRGKQKETTMTEFPCWWFVNDPIRYHACRNCCSRKRDLHSYRRHHFEDHWRWGDVAADGISFEKWNAAKHATCDLTGLTEDKRAHRKWERSYRIYFGLRELDPIPQPICPDVGHVHYRPKRPITHELPTSRQQSSSDPEPHPFEGQKAPTIANSLNEFSSGISFLGDLAHPPSIPHLFPEINPEGYGDPFQYDYFALWNDRFDIASDLIHTASSIESPKLVVNDYVTRIREILELMYNNPQEISQASIATVLSLAQHFELDFMQAAIDNNHLHRYANFTALSNPPGDLLSDSQTQIEIDTMPITARAGARSSANVHQQSSENYSDGQTSGSEFLNAPETPSAEDDTYVWVNSSHADVRAATEVSKADAPPKSEMSIPGQDLNIYW